MAVEQIACWSMSSSSDGRISVSFAAATVAQLDDVLTALKGVRMVLQAREDRAVTATPPRLGTEGGMLARRRLPSIVLPPSEMEQDDKIVALQREELMLSNYAGKGGQAKLLARIAEIRQAIRRLKGWEGADAP